MKQWYATKVLRLIVALTIFLFLILFLIVSCTSIRQPLNVTKDGEDLVCGPSLLVSNQTPSVEKKQSLENVSSSHANSTPASPLVTPARSAAKRIVFKEGDLVSLHPNVSDPDQGDLPMLSFSKPLNASGEWQSKKGNAGEYPITITATDGKETTTITVVVVLEATDLQPTLEVLSMLNVNEGDPVELKPVVKDPENQTVSVTFSSPVDQKGTWRPGFNDAGNYTITITASDGKNTATKTVALTVYNKNRAPFLDSVPSVVVKEGQLVEVKPKAADPDDDAVTFTFGSPFTIQGTWQTKVGDAGNYTTKITASDGSLADEKTVLIVVNKANHAPAIDYLSELTVVEGDNVILTPNVTDADGDKVDVIYTDPFNKNGQWQTGYTDAGVREVTITANDGKEATSWKVKVTVRDKNRPPEIVI